MKIAIACHNGKEISDHTGRCRRFLIYKITREKVTARNLLELTKEQTFHEHHGRDFHPMEDIQVLISRGMGPGLYHRLEADGVDVFITEETDPELALMKYLAGTLESGEPHEHSQCKY